mgnify:CR=1 FL=1
MVDFYYAEKGVTIRFLNPDNIVIYIEVKQFLTWFYGPDYQQHFSQEDIQKLLEDLLKKIAEILHLEETKVTLL